MLTRYNMVPILKRWRSMPVTLRRILFDRQAGYFYINGPIKKWCRARESNSVFLIKTRHITTATRCLQSSIAPQEHAPPLARAGGIAPLVIYRPL